MILEIGGTIRFFSVLGGILAGVISDYSGGRATTCCAMLIIAAPMVSQTVLFFFFFFLCSDFEQNANICFNKMLQID